jgi:hypothetical protein
VHILAWQVPVQHSAPAVQAVPVPPQQLPVPALQMPEVQAPGVPMQLMPSAMPTHLPPVHVPEQHSALPPHTALALPQQLPLTVPQEFEVQSAGLPSQDIPLAIPSQALLVQLFEQHCDGSVQAAPLPTQHAWAVTLQVLRPPHAPAPQPRVAVQPHWNMLLPMLMHAVPPRHPEQLLQMPEAPQALSALPSAH